MGKGSLEGTRPLWLLSGLCLALIPFYSMPLLFFQVSSQVHDFQGTQTLSAVTFCPSAWGHLTIHDLYEVLSGAK